MGLLRRVLLVLAVAIFAFDGSAKVFAVELAPLDTNSNAYRTRNNIIFYDPNDGATCAATTGTTTLQGNTNREKAYRFLIGKGLSAEQAAGVIGNLMVESGMIPDNQENSQPWPQGGWGLAQWTGSRRTDIKNAVEKAGLPYTNEKTPPDKIEALLAFELNFLWDEATKRGDIDKLKTEKTIDGAVLSWERNFEIAGNPALGARGTAAHKAFNDFGGNISNEPGSGSGSVPVAAGTGASAAAGCSPNNVAGNFVYYSQYDPAWAKSSYGSSTIISSGCGPTSMAMIVATLTGNTSVTPKVIATKYSSDYIRGVGSSHALFGHVAEDYDLIATSIGPDEAKVKATLETGGLVVAGGSGPAPFTNSGHIIVIRKVDESGAYLVGNPLPSPTDQGKSSATVVQNTGWFNTTYTWAQLSANTSGMYAIEKHQ